MPVGVQIVQLSFLLTPTGSNNVIWMQVPKHVGRVRFIPATWPHSQLFWRLAGGAISAVKVLSNSHCHVPLLRVPSRGVRKRNDRYGASLLLVRQRAWTISKVLPFSDASDAPPRHPHSSKIGDQKQWPDKSVSDIKRLLIGRPTDPAAVHLPILDLLTFLYFICSPLSPY